MDAIAQRPHNPTLAILPGNIRALYLPPPPGPRPLPAPLFPHLLPPPGPRPLPAPLLLLHLGNIRARALFVLFIPIAFLLGNIRARAPFFFLILIAILPGGGWI